jgi:hypothetical protein
LVFKVGVLGGKSKKEITDMPQVAFLLFCFFLPAPALLAPLPLVVAGSVIKRPIERKSFRGEPKGKSGGVLFRWRVISHFSPSKYIWVGFHSDLLKRGSMYKDQCLSHSRVAAFKSFIGEVRGTAPSKVATSKIRRECFPK